MKNLKFLILSAFILLISMGMDAQNLKPYTIGAIGQGSVEEVAELVKKELKSADFEVLGSYKPINHEGRRIIAFTSYELKSAVEQVGGLTGFALAWRVAVTDEENGVIVSYNTPKYWGNAYFTKSYKKVKDLYGVYAKKIETALAKVGGEGGVEYGSKKGLEEARLQRYRYKVLMPQFDDTQVLAKFDSYEEAVNTIDQNLKNGIANLTEVYSVTLPDKKVKLYGIGLSGENGEGKFMPKIDISTPKHTAFLPYEILVVDNKVHMLHGRFRIALSFPDLSMGTFMKIMSTPGDIKDLMEMACKSES
ncbi:MAG: hypothetical protein HKN68_07435 [Saprospiraceae bacterium]|nr:hypothetical protein [Saprospiraceae bacterium]